MSKVNQNLFNVAVKKGNKELIVYMALKANMEGGNMVYLPNAQSMAENAGVTAHEFAGYLSSLKQQGKYQPVDKFFGEMI